MVVAAFLEILMGLPIFLYGPGALLCHWSFVEGRLDAEDLHPTRV